MATCAHSKLAPTGGDYRLSALSADELLDEKAGLSGLSLVGQVGGAAKTPIHRYRFSPQDSDLRGGEDLRQIGGDKFGKVEAISSEERTVDIKKRRDTANIHPEAVFVHDIVDTKVLVDALVRLGEAVADYGLLGKGPYRAGVTVLSDFQTPDLFQTTQLSTTGDTPMGAAILQGLEMLRQRKNAYRANGVDYFRSWVFLITDGAPTDSWQAAAQAVRDGEAKDEFVFFAIAVEGADMETLAQIATATRPPRKLSGLKFRELFAWLSSSLSGVSRSQVGDRVPLPPTDGWTEV